MFSLIPNVLATSDLLPIALTCLPNVVFKCIECRIYNNIIIMIVSINTGPIVKLPIALKESGKLITLAFVNCKDIPLNVNIVPSVVINGFILRITIKKPFIAPKIIPLIIIIENAK